ncbi:hypothetical protein DH2020_020978 [Rehmannia glutinosa]|uniref:Chlororespiratory reduction 42 n=1 Tax=Rehmannia glutinosa TaxID=99300 RepID=A0ABR0W919_REHGL
MALNLSSMPSSGSFARPIIRTPIVQSYSLKSQIIVTKCELNESSSADTKLGAQKVSKLEIGSPIVVIEAPQVLKTAASVPCLRANAGLVKPGDVGRIVSRKPKDVWAIRLSIGTYLIDGKYFKPLEIDD